MSGRSTADDAETISAVRHSPRTLSGSAFKVGASALIAASLLMPHTAAEAATVKDSKNRMATKAKSKKSKSKAVAQKVASSTTTTSTVAPQTTTTSTTTPAKTSNYKNLMNQYALSALQQGANAFAVGPSLLNGLPGITARIVCKRSNNVESRANELSGSIVGNAVDAVKASIRNPLNNLDKPYIKSNSWSKSYQDIVGEADISLSVASGIDPLSMPSALAKLAILVAGNPNVQAVCSSTHPKLPIESTPLAGEITDYKSEVMDSLYMNAQKNSFRFLKFIPGLWTSTDATNPRPYIGIYGYCNNNSGYGTVVPVKGLDKPNVVTDKIFAGLTGEDRNALNGNVVVENGSPSLFDFDVLLPNDKVSGDIDYTKFEQIVRAVATDSICKS